jgi:gluconate kinase
MYYLEIEVKKIAFHDHPLMSEEEFHCKQIVGMCSLFLDTREKNLLGYYKERVVVRSFHFINFKALTTELEKLRELESKNVYSATDQRLKKMSNIRAELKKIRVEAESQEYRQLGLVANIASKWKLIKSIREKNHLTTCNVRIQFEKIEHDDDDNILEHDIKEELLEMEEEGLEFDIDAEYDKIRSRLLTCRRKPGAPELVPVISKCDLTKEEELSVQEKNRMKTIKSKEYLVELVINNVPVSSTTAQPLRCVDGSYFVVKVCYIRLIYNIGQ